MLRRQRKNTSYLFSVLMFLTKLQQVTDPEKVGCTKSGVNN